MKCVMRYGRPALAPRRALPLCVSRPSCGYGQAGEADRAAAAQVATLQVVGVTDGMQGHLHRVPPGVQDGTRRLPAATQDLLFTGACTIDVARQVRLGT